jgi:nucleotide-binding universal stress UspA family protein
VMHDSWISLPVHASAPDCLTRPRVVVGVSGGPAGEAALRLGADLAQTAALRLHLVRVFREAEWMFSAPPDELAELADDEQHQRSLLSSAYLTAKQLAPSAVVTAEFVPGSVYELLLVRAKGAHALVLGARTDDEPGPVARWHLRHAECAVLIVNGAGHVVGSAREQLLRAPARAAVPAAE